MKNRQETSLTRPPRVVWTDAEKARLIAKAVEVQSTRPDLAGLPLLRASMSVLPKPRRRRIIAVTKAPWFETGVAEEIKRRTAQSRADSKTHKTTLVASPDDPYIPHLAQTAEFGQIQNKQTAEWRLERQRFEDAAAQTGESIVTLLSLVLRELVALNAKLGQPVPVMEPCECHEADEQHKGAVKAARN